MGVCYSPNKTVLWITTHESLWAGRQSAADSGASPDCQTFRSAVAGSIQVGWRWSDPRLAITTNMPGSIPKMGICFEIGPMVVWPWTISKWGFTGYKESSKEQPPGTTVYLYSTSGQHSHPVCFKETVPITASLLLQVFPVSLEYKNKPIQHNQAEAGKVSWSVGVQSTVAPKESKPEGPPKCCLTWISQEVRAYSTGVIWTPCFALCYIICCMI